MTKLKGKSDAELTRFALSYAKSNVEDVAELLFNGKSQLTDEDDLYHVLDTLESQQSKLHWTAHQLMGEIAAILVRLENDKADDAMEMAKQIIGYTPYYDQAAKEYQEELAEEKAAFRQQMLTTLLDMEGEGLVEHADDEEHLIDEP